MAMLVLCHSPELSSVYVIRKEILIKSHVLKKVHIGMIQANKFWAL